MNREEKIAAAFAKVSAAREKFGRCPEGGALFMAMWIKLASEAENILSYPGLTEKEKL